MPTGFRQPLIRVFCAVVLSLLALGAQAEARRVVSLAPHLTELVYLLGAEAQLVGVVEYSDFPPEAEQLPRIGDAFRFDMERILALEADLALAWVGGTPAATIADLERLGIEVLAIETARLEQIGRALERIAGRLDIPQRGRLEARRFEDRLGAIRARYRPSEQREISVFYQVSRQPLFTLGRDHIINDALAVCGMRNVFEDLASEAAVVDIEAVLMRRPDLILAAANAGTNDPLALWREHGWQPSELRAIDPDRLIRPTPRILDGIDELCRLQREPPDNGP